MFNAKRQGVKRRRDCLSIALLLCLGVLTSCSSLGVEKIVPQNKNLMPVNSEKFTLKAEFSGKTIIFTMTNTSSEDLLLDDDFCLFSEMKTIIISERRFVPLKSEFASAMYHPSYRLLQLKPNEQVDCSVSYVSHKENEKDNVGAGLIVWQVDYFAADMHGQSWKEKQAGVIPVILPIGSSDAKPITIPSAAEIVGYENRDTLGIKYPHK